jgi:hypothetical protein
MAVRRIGACVFSLLALLCLAFISACGGQSDDTGQTEGTKTPTRVQADGSVRLKR